MPAYPSEADISYGLWLKYFASRLPAYADRYGLSVLQVLKVQCLAGEYLDLLIWRLQYKTASIVRRQATLAPANIQPLTREAAGHREYGQLIKDLVYKVAEHVRRHPAYTTQDEQALQLDNSLTPPVHLACCAKLAC